MYRFYCCNFTSELWLENQDLRLKSENLRHHAWDLKSEIWDWRVGSVSIESHVKWSYHDKRWMYHWMCYCKMKLISYFTTWSNKNLSIEYMLSYSYLRISIPRTGLWSKPGLDPLWVLAMWPSLLYHLWHHSCPDQLSTDIAVQQTNQCLMFLTHWLLSWGMHTKE